MLTGIVFSYPSCLTSRHMTIRPPAFAGTLYEADTQRLLVQVETLLDQKTRYPLPKPPKALIVPHSAYPYSAKNAAPAYRLLESVYDTIRRVVILGPSHRVPLDGIAIPEADIFQTPLGRVNVDQKTVSILKDIPVIEQNIAAHQSEHSLEVQLPLLQIALDDFLLVPLIVGNCDVNAAKEVIENIWGDDETLIIISTGLSRDKPYEEVLDQDRRSAERIRLCDSSFRYDQACGYNALNAFLKVASHKKLDSKCLGLTTSADQYGNKERVRGFGSFVFW